MSEFFDEYRIDQSHVAIHDWVQIRVGPFHHLTLFGDTSTAVSRLLSPNLGTSPI